MISGRLYYFFMKEKNYTYDHIDDSKDTNTDIEEKNEYIDDSVCSYPGVDEEKIAICDNNDATHVTEPHLVDMHVGNRLRRLRIQLRMTQKQLAGVVNLTFQQIQKYERGLNRISCSRLYEFACTLNVHVSYFFEGIIRNSYDQYVKSVMSCSDASLSEREFTYNHDGEDIIGELDRLIVSFRDIKNSKLRNSILMMLNALRDSQY